MDLHQIAIANADAICLVLALRFCQSTFVPVAGSRDWLAEADSGSIWWLSV